MVRGGRGGSIVGISSIEATRAAPGYAVYAACKAAMINFTQSMALELSDDAIRVNTVSPDHTITPGGRGNRSGPVDPSTWVQRSPDRKSVLSGKRASVRVDLGGRRIITKKKTQKT